MLQYCWQIGRLLAFPHKLAVYNLDVANDVSK